MRVASHNARLLEFLPVIIVDGRGDGCPHAADRAAAIRAGQPRASAQRLPVFALRPAATWSAAATAFGGAATERRPSTGDVAVPALPMRNAATRSSIILLCCSSVLDVAAFSSTSAEFCCVTSSICVRALLISSRTGRLLDAGIGDIGNHVDDVLDGIDDLAQRRSGAVDQVNSVLHLIVAVGDEVLDVLGGL